MSRRSKHGPRKGQHPSSPPDRAPRAPEALPQAEQQQPVAIPEDTHALLGQGADVGGIFSRLGETVQQMLGIITVYGEPVALKSLEDCVRTLRGERSRARWNLPAGRPALLELLRAMETAGLVAWDGSAAACRPALMAPALGRLLDTGTVSDVGRQLRYTLDRSDDGPALREKPLPGGGKRSHFGARIQAAMREGRLALFEERWPDLSRAIGILAPMSDRTDIPDNPVWQLFHRPLEPRLFDRAPASVRDKIAYSLLVVANGRMEPAPDLCTWAATLAARGETQPASLIRLELLDRAMLEGNLAEARGMVGMCQNPARARMAEGALAFLEGDDQKAIRSCEAVFKGRQETKLCDNLCGGMYALACLRSGTPEQLRKCLRLAGQVASEGDDCRQEFALLALALRSRMGDSPSEAPARLPGPRITALGLLLLDLVPYWLGMPFAAEDLARLAGMRQRAERAGFRVLAAEFATLHARVAGTASLVAEAERLREGLPVSPFVDILSSRQAWQHALDALQELADQRRDHRRARQKDAEKRLAWFLTWVSEGEVTLTARVESREGEDDAWRGRAIPLRRLLQEAPGMAFLCDADRDVVGRIRPSKKTSSSPCTLAPEEALPLLIAHPTLFWEDQPGVRVDIVRSRPALRLTREGDRFRLRLEPSPPPPGKAFVLVRDGAVLHLVEFAPDDRRLAAIVGPEVVVPASGEQQLLAVVSCFARDLPVHSDLALGEVEEIAADGRLHLRLLPLGDGLSIEARVCPLGEAGLAALPGRGARSVTSEVEGRRLQATRDLADEERRLQALLAACPALTSAARDAGTATWTLEEAQDCLEFLLEVANVPEVVLEWPQGQRFRVRRGTFVGGMHISRKGDWFAVDASFQIDGERVLSLRKLLAMLEEAHGRFVPLGAGEFLALTEEFRRRLLDLAGYAELRGEGVRFHPVASRAVDESLSALATVEGDGDWTRWRERLSAGVEAVLPHGLEAEPRDYQEEGFRWLARVAGLELGACLADDMGLGKTLQALMMLLHRAPGGPALVVAPTSVCTNWMEEALRFAPTLRMRLHAGASRARDLLDLETGDGRFEVVVTTYTTLQLDLEILAGIRWHSLVLDEAQAIKNFQTQRARAARELKADFRMVTTGTPIENHLLELWSLFDFLNPGLLGSRKRFTERFALPIEKDGDHLARTRLKRLVQPFILRRTKAQVLDELPPRTDITLHLEMSEDERALYEAVRQEILDKLRATDTDAVEARFVVLAGITRLRRACCHPRLILPATGITSSRLETLADVVEELRESHHRALVFSQFVDHLALVREHLDAHSIPYQYLDGSTPMEERARRVEAFQSGEGDLFLISLKAGGTGLNLTGADYVIHLDPWWNPAVEDQASDRAHRIGQQRPVTVYRFVARGTIEDRIVDLHRHKRDLAGSLLEGTDAAGRLSTEALIKLLEEEA